MHTTVSIYQMHKTCSYRFAINKDVSFSFVGEQKLSTCLQFDHSLTSGDLPGWTFQLQIHVHTLKLKKHSSSLNISTKLFVLHTVFLQFTQTVNGGGGGVDQLFCHFPPTAALVKIIWHCDITTRVFLMVSWRLG